MSININKIIRMIKKSIHKKIMFYVALFIGLPMIFIVVLLLSNEFSQAIELVNNIYILIASAVSFVSALAIFSLLIMFLNAVNKFKNDINK